MKEKGIDKYANTQYTGNTVHKQQCVHNTQIKIKCQYSSQEGESTNVLLQERSLDEFYWTIKWQNKANYK